MTQNLIMVLTTGDMSVYSRRGKYGVMGVVECCVEDTIFCGTKAFEEESGTIGEIFKSSSRVYYSATLSGQEISISADVCCVSLGNYACEINTLPTFSGFEEFRS